MRFDRRGEGGFMESMVAVMAVVLSLTAFLAIFPYAFDDSGRTDRVPTEILDGMSVGASGISFATDIGIILDDKGFSAVRIVVRVIGIGGVYEFTFGDRGSDDMIYTTGTTLISIDGRKMNAEYEMAVWR